MSARRERDPEPLELSWRIELAREQLLLMQERGGGILTDDDLLDCMDDWSTSNVGAYPEGSAEEAEEMQDYDQIRDAVLPDVTRLPDEEG